MTDKAESAAFDPRGLERGYAFLAQCPECVFDEIVTFPAGTLHDRVAGIRRWHDALLGGQLPPADCWPPSEIADPVRAALTELDLPRFCKDQPELVEAVLKDVVSAFVRGAATFAREAAQRLEELEALERTRREQLVKSQKQGNRGAPGSGQGRGELVAGQGSSGVEIDEVTRERLRREAEETVRARPRPSDAQLRGAWVEHARAWADIAEVFGELGQMLGRGWDLSRGVLKHVGWRNLVALHDLVRKLPELRDLVRTLGRLHDSTDDETVAEKVLGPVRRLEEERREVRAPDVPAETRGVERSGDIARMLPAEAVLLGHPQLRLLWHARRAERALITYRTEGTEIERVQVERESTEELDGKRARQQRGPIVAVIDTSGSMRGTPEEVAKAIVLEAVRVAHSERRRCLLYSYSGPGDVAEHELDMSPDGVGRLLDFLALSFGGGTDIGVIEAVAKRLQEDAWRKADVVVVSDGEWTASSTLVSRVHAAREQGTRFHGVQVGSHRNDSFNAICDPVHRFSDWGAVVKQGG